MNPPSIFLPCLLGPTGVGKSAAALALAERCDVSVINADSRQVYRDFPVITAQPTRQEQAVCPHLLYGFLNASEKLGAGEYARLAEKAVLEEGRKGRLPLLVGGTGLYVKALLEGLAPIPEVPAAVSELWKQRAEAEGLPALHELLRELDPRYAAKIRPEDPQRIRRALEVWTHTGKTFSEWHDMPLPPRPFAPLKIGMTLPLAELESRLAERIERMLEQGAQAEAEAALGRNPDPAAPGWSGIGCRELHQYLAGDISLNTCKEQWLRNTRAYAKRQMTWFKADREIRWFAPHEATAAAEYVLDAGRIAAEASGLRF